MPQPDLHGHYAALMVDAHQDAERGVENDPSRQKGPGRGARFGDVDGAEDKGNSREKKPRLLVRT